jgi:hypothetical protein
MFTLADTLDLKKNEGVVKMSENKLEENISRKSELDGISPSHARVLLERAIHRAHVRNERIVCLIIIAGRVSGEIHLMKKQRRKEHVRVARNRK